MAIEANKVFTVHKVLGNRSPLRAILQNNAGVAINVTGLAITFRMVLISDGTVKVSDQSATIVTAAAGEVEYAFTTGDVDTLGTYACYFQDNSSPIRRWPYDGAKLQLVIQLEVTN
jgi:hypothetical protein